MNYGEVVSTGGAEVVSVEEVVSVVAVVVSVVDVVVSMVVVVVPSDGELACGELVEVAGAATVTTREAEPVFPAASVAE